MSTRRQEHDTIFRNVRLIATRWNAFVFLIHPMVSCAWMLYTCFKLRKSNGILASRAHFAFAVLIWPTSVMLLAMVTGQKIKEQLEADGYVQRRTRPAEVDLIINFAVVGAFLYWAQHYESDGRESAFATGFLAVFGGLVMWWVVVLMSLGPILWFTVKVR